MNAPFQHYKLNKSRIFSLGLHTLILYTGRTVVADKLGIRTFKIFTLHRIVHLFTSANIIPFALQNYLVLMKFLTILCKSLLCFW
jgi:hypothetical protein